MIRVLKFLPFRHFSLRAVSAFVLLLVSAWIVEVHAAGEPFDTADKYATMDGWKFQYIPIRQALHERIIGQRMLQGSKSDAPRIIFTAGPFGAGKSVAIGALRRAGIVDTSEFLWIDPDALKEEIPEYDEFKKANPLNAATLVHKESGHIQEQLLERALKEGKNIIVDGSLSGKGWWSHEFKRIRTQYPKYSLSIVYVNADEKTIRERIEDRGRKTGRFIPEELVKKNIQAVTESVAELKKLTDTTVEITNDLNPRIASYYKDGKDHSVSREVAMDDPMSLLIGKSAQNQSAPARAKNHEPKWASEDSLTATAADRPVIFLHGFGSEGYENPAWAKAYVAQFVSDKPNAVFVLDGNQDGIGEARQWIPNLARESRGNVSVVDIPAEKQLALAEKVRGTFVFLSGDQKSVAELRSAIARGINVTLVTDKNLHPIPERVAEKMIADPRYDPDGFDRLTDVEYSKVNRISSLKPVDPWEVQTGERVRQAALNLDKTPDMGLVTFLVQNYPELLLLANDKVIATPEGQREQATQSSKPTTTIEIDRKDFSQRMKWLTNAELPNQAVGPTDGLTRSFSEQLFGKNFVEFDRAVMNTLILKWILEGNYEQFTAVQKDNVKLSHENFNEMRKFIQSVISTPEDRDAMLVFLQFNNLGKAKQMIEYLRENARISATNHQAVLSEVLRRYPFVAPSFVRLSARHQNMILESLETEFNMGQLIQGESAAGHLAELAKKSPEGLRFYLATSILKLAGAAGHMVRNGSAVMTQPTYNGLRRAIQAVSTMGEGASETKAYDDFLLGRAKDLKINIEEVGEPFAKAAARICLLMRYQSADQASIVLQEMKGLDDGSRAILVDHLTRTGLGEQPAFLLYYAPATMQNLRASISQQGIEGDRLAVRDGLKLISNLFSVADSSHSTQHARGIFQIRLDAVAEAAKVAGGTSGKEIRLVDGPLGRAAELVAPTPSLVPLGDPACAKTLGEVAKAEKGAAESK